MHLLTYLIARSLFIQLFVPWVSISPPSRPLFVSHFVVPLPQRSVHVPNTIQSAVHWTTWVHSSNGIITLYFLSFFPYTPPTFAHYMYCTQYEKQTPYPNLSTRQT